MRRVILAAAAVVAIGAPFLTASTASAAPAAPAFTCGTQSLYLTNAQLLGGNLWYDHTQDRFEMQSKATYLCAAQSGTLSHGELNIVGTNNCVTYTGPQTGNSPLGYLRGSVTCGNKASQKWSWVGSGELWNDYTGSSWCLDGPRLTGKPFMEGCNSNDLAQLWQFNNTMAPGRGGLVRMARLTAVSSPVPAGPSTHQFDYWCSNEYTGHFGCDFYPSTAGPEFGVNANPYAWPGYAFIYNSTNLMLSNGSSGCLHVVKPSSGVDWMNVVTCHSYDKNQRWSFPNGGLEIKSSGDVRCVQLDFDVITGWPNGYGMAICNGSNSNQDWKWFGPGT